MVLTTDNVTTLHKACAEWNKENPTKKILNARDYKKDRREELVEEMIDMGFRFDDMGSVSDSDSEEEEVVVAKPKKGGKAAKAKGNGKAKKVVASVASSDSNESDEEEEEAVVSDDDYASVSDSPAAPPIAMAPNGGGFYVVDHFMQCHCQHVSKEGFFNKEDANDAAEALFDRAYGAPKNPKDPNHCIRTSNDGMKTMYHFDGRDMHMVSVSFCKVK